MLNDRGEQILARFPGPVTVTPILTLSRGLLITGSALFAIVFLWLVWRGWQDSHSSTWGLGLCAAFFAFAAVGSAVVLRTNRMTLDREGFEIVAGTMIGIRKKRFPWSEVSAFEMLHLRRGNYVVTFDDARKGGGMLAGVNRTLGFHNSTLPEDYGLGDDQLAKLLNYWCALAKASGDREPTGP